MTPEQMISECESGLELLEEIRLKILQEPISVPVIEIILNRIILLRAKISKIKRATHPRCM